MKQKHILKNIFLFVFLCLIFCSLPLSYAPGQNEVPVLAEAQTDDTVQEAHFFKQNYEYQTDFAVLDKTTGRLSGSASRLEQVRSIQKLLSFLYISFIFSCCTYNRKMFLSYIQFYAHLLARFLCELFTLKKKDGKKRLFLFSALGKNEKVCIINA